MWGHNSSVADKLGSWSGLPGLYDTGRRHDRTAMTAPVTMLVECEGKMVAYPAQIVDVTEQGIRIKVSVALIPREIVVIMPSEGPRYAVGSRVVWAGEAGFDREWEMGLEFQNPVLTTCWRPPTET